MFDNFNYFFVIKYIQKNLEFAKKQSDDFNESNYIHKKEECIWIFWWQGIENMPPIVSSCFKSVIKNSNGHKVILITKDNVREYTDIPDYIYKKVNNGNITLTHFSDILRFNLLKNHGGLWIDSTVYVAKKINENYFNYLYTSGGYNSKTNPLFVGGKWTGFLIGGYSYNKLFVFMDSFFKDYWKNNKKLVNYFLIDYALRYAYDNEIGNFNDYVDNVAKYNNPSMFELQPRLNCIFDKDQYDKMCRKTDMFKLTYKMDFYDNKDTFYTFIVNCRY